MKKIIIILIITLTTFMGGNIYTKNKEFSSNEYVENNVEIVDKIPENIIITPEENITISDEKKEQEIVENNAIEEEQISVENKQNISTQKQEKIVEQPKVQEVPKVEEQKQVSQPKEEPKVVETKTEPIKEPEPVTPKCDGSNHGVGVGNSNKWFNSKQEAIKYYNGILKTWGDKWEKFEIDSETYDKNCPYGYEIWTCPLCGKWTINFYYR